MVDPHEWSAPTFLDQVNISVEFDRTVSPEVVHVRLTGTSRKRSHPLWTWSATEDDDRNVAHMLSWLMGGIAFYRPTTNDKFLRAVVGGSITEENPSLLD